jgi:hypothetical protein
MAARVHVETDGLGRPVDHPQDVEPVHAVLREVAVPPDARNSGDLLSSPISAASR